VHCGYGFPSPASICCCCCCKHIEKVQAYSGAVGSSNSSRSGYQEWRGVGLMWQVVSRTSVGTAVVFCVSANVHDVCTSAPPHGLICAHGCLLRPHVSLYCIVYCVGPVLQWKGVFPTLLTPAEHSCAHCSSYDFHACLVFVFDVCLC